MSELASFLSDISAKDASLRTHREVANSEPLPPVRSRILPPARAAPKAELASVSVAAAAPSAPAAAAARTKGTKGTAHRKHAYEYFSEWDKFDVDGELAKIDEASAEQTAVTGSDAAATATDAAASREATTATRVPPSSEADDEGLPPGMTSDTLASMPRVEVERRALHEKSKGNDHYRTGDYVSAAAAYTHSLRLDPANAVVYANRAMCALKQKRYALALNDSSAAIELDDGYTKAFLRRAISYRHLSMSQEALADLEVVLKHEPRNSEALQLKRSLEREGAQPPTPAAKPLTGAGSGEKGGRRRVLIEEISGDDVEAEGDDKREDDAPRIVEIVQSHSACPEESTLARVQREQEAQRRQEAERAAQNEREALGGVLDREAAQESAILLEGLAKLSDDDGFVRPEMDTTRQGASAKVSAEESAVESVKQGTFAEHGASASREGSRRLVIEETDDDDEAEEVEEVPIRRPAQMRQLVVEDVSGDEGDRNFGEPNFGEPNFGEGADGPNQAKERELGSSAPAGMRTLTIQDVESDDDAPLGDKGEEQQQKAREETREETWEETREETGEKPLAAAAESLRQRADRSFGAHQYAPSATLYTDALAAAGLFPLPPATALPPRRLDFVLACLGGRAACSCQLQDYLGVLHDTSYVLELRPEEASALARRAFAKEALEDFEASLASLF